MEKMERTLAKLVTVVQEPKDNGCAVKKEDEEVVVNDIHVLRLPSRDAYAYALQLMDVYFTKEELAKSLVFKSKKSSKPPLDPKKVEQILKLIVKRFGDKSWDMKTLTLKMNQKCRDSRPAEVHCSNTCEPQNGDQNGADQSGDQSGDQSD